MLVALLFMAQVATYPSGWTAQLFVLKVSDPIMTILADGEISTKLSSEEVGREFWKNYPTDPYFACEAHPPTSVSTAVHSDVFRLSNREGDDIIHIQPMGRIEILTRKQLSAASLVMWDAIGRELESRCLKYAVRGVWEGGR